MQMSGGCKWRYGNSKTCFTTERPQFVNTTADVVWKIVTFFFPFPFWDNGHITSHSILAEDHGSAEVFKKLLLNIRKRWWLFLLLLVLCGLLFENMHSIEFQVKSSQTDPDMAWLLQVAVPFSFLCHVSKEMSLRLIQEHRKQKLDKEKAKWKEEILT
ncbi:hypothetical protein SADUNF_Sadunf06G0163300 [Salix dunnii]|uniref:Uncharacterized protein n=1 Tax=Salix dunnii TaxID=1413687 RepID=A0A835N104_9ROSI|nr:hypothetical protein SADUNF_Sadunf06G0163300 [Salix dunnii]